MATVLYIKDDLLLVARALLGQERYEVFSVQLRKHPHVATLYLCS